MRSVGTVLLALAAACSYSDVPPADSLSSAHPRARATRPEAAVAGVDGSSPAPLPSSAAADSMLTRYLALVAERDGFSPAQFAGIHSEATPCVEETFGDVISSYWLARGRVLDYSAEADTLRARLELITVAAQQPDSGRAYGSVVSARIRTDTLVLKLVPDSARRRWQVCGLLSDDFRLGGYGRPDNVRYSPPSVTRMTLLAQVDSIRQATSTR